MNRKIILHEVKESCETRFSFEFSVSVSGFFTFLRFTGCLTELSLGIV